MIAYNQEAQGQPPFTRARLTKDLRGNNLPFLAVRRKPSGAAKPEGLGPTASFNPVIYFRAAPKECRALEYGG